jgi:putative SOS response-associated peptidase YedK
MCGRFTSTTPVADLASWFEADDDGLPELGPNFNVTPTSDIFTVVTDPDGQRRLDIMRWGLVPSWADDPSIASRLINARSETIAEKPSFRSAFARRRCLIPVDGFYEWVPSPVHRRKQPTYICARDRRPLAFAGLWEMWRPKGTDRDAPALRTCTIITGPPNATIAPLHDRMPMILANDAWSAWLDTATPATALHRLLAPAPDDLLDHWAVSVAVNDVRRHDAALIEPGSLPDDGELPGQTSMF